MLWSLIFQVIGLLQAGMARLMNVEYHFTQNATGDGQWAIDHYSFAITPKGSAVMDAIMTVVHYGLDFVAQLTTLLPAVNSTAYSTATGAGLLTGP